MEDSDSITVTNKPEDRHVQDALQDEHADPQEPKYTPAASEPGGGTDATEGGANKINKEEEKTKAVGKKEEVTEQTVLEQDKEQDKERGAEENKTGEIGTEGKESINESLTKENDSDKTDDVKAEEGKLKEKHKKAKRTTDYEDQTEKTEKDRSTEEMKEKDYAQDKQTCSAKKSGPASSSALRASTKSSVCPRPSVRRDAMKKFQKDQTPAVQNFKVQRTSIGMAGGASIKQKILQWCRNKTETYEGVNIDNFSSSWNNGLAFCALIHHFFPTAFDFSSLKASEREKNFSLAFSTAESLADCCPLLEVSDMLLMGKHPDPLCVFTYVQSLCHHLSKIDKERKEKENTEDKNKEDQQQVEEGEERREREQHEENGSDSSMKTVEETDQNVMNTDVGKEINN